VRVSDQHRLLFVHVQKTGGNTVRSVFNSAAPDARNPLGDLPKHAHLGGILRAEPGLAAYDVFGFVRNPWARMVSWWSMIQDAKTNAEAGNAGAVARLRTNRFMRLVATTYETFDDFAIRGPAEFPRLRTPQLRYLVTPARRADFIGRTEHLATDLPAAFARVGVVIEEVPQANASSARPPYQEFYSEAARRHIADVYAEDVTEFGYAF
jgi:hypothetical protein